MPEPFERLHLTEDMLRQSGGRVLRQLGVRSTYRIGLTPTQYVNAKRMGMAARLLLESDLPVIEVGSACSPSATAVRPRRFATGSGRPHPAGIPLCYSAFPCSFPLLF